MSASDANNDRQKTQTELEMEAGRKALERYAGQRGVPVTPKKLNHTTTVIPFSLGETIDTGIVAAAAAKEAQGEGVKRETPPVERSPAFESVDKVQAPLADDTADPDAAMAFLDDFFGTDKRHLVAIKKHNGRKSEIEAHHFDALDRDGQQKFLTDYGNAGSDIYFSPNPIKGPLHKKASKNDVVEACHLWIDLDPRVNEPLEAERAAMLPLLTNKLCQGIPRPNRVIDSGRGYWGYWKLATPQPVDGSENNMNGPLTEAVESYGRGIEQAFDDRFADGCRNIDRIARLPGTVNTKTGHVARVLHEFSHDEPHAIECFPRSVEKPEDQATPKGEKFKSSAKFEPIEPDDPLLAKLGEKWRAMIAADDYAADYKNDHSRAEFALVCEAIRVEIDDATIVRVLMDSRRRFGSHTREKVDYRLPRIINRGHEFAIDPDLADMNEKFFVAPIGDATRVVSMKDDPKFPGRKIIGRAQSFAAFEDLHSNKRKRWKTTDKDGSVKITSIPLGSWWLRQERRRQYDGGMAFMPQNDADVVGDTLNTWPGFAVQSRKPEGKSGAAGCQLMLDHIKNVLCSGNEEHYDYFIKREAKIIQERCRTEIGMILRSMAEGTGKGFYEKHVHGKLLGSAYMQVTHPEHVIGKHNQHLENLLVLCADEALFAGDPRHRNALYSLITEPTIAVEPKFVGVYSAPNFVNVDLLSNMDHVVSVGPTARRLFVPTVSEDKVGDLEYFAKIESQLQNGGYEALLYHLQHEINLRDFDVRKVPKTEGLAEQARYSRKGIDLLVETVCNEARVPCEIERHPDCSRTDMDQTEGSFDYFLAKSKDRELQKPLTVKRRLCAEWECKSGDATRIWNGSRHVSCIQWPPLAALRELFAKRHGPQTWDRADVTEWGANTNSNGNGATKAQAPPRLATEDRAARTEMDVALEEYIKTMGPHEPIKTQAVAEAVRLELAEGNGVGLKALTKAIAQAQADHKLLKSTS